MGSFALAGFFYREIDADLSTMSNVGQWQSGTYDTVRLSNGSTLWVNEDMVSPFSEIYEMQGSGYGNYDIAYPFVGSTASISLISDTRAWVTWVTPDDKFVGMMIDELGQPLFGPAEIGVQGANFSTYFPYAMQVLPLPPSRIYLPIVTR